MLPNSAHERGSTSTKSHARLTYQPEDFIASAPIASSRGQRSNSSIGRRDVTFTGPHDDSLDGEIDTNKSHFDVIEDRSQVYPSVGISRSHYHQNKPGCYPSDVGLNQPGRQDMESVLPSLDTPGSSTTPLSSSTGWPLTLELQANFRPHKTRREKPRIELASDQPPTTQGKPRARVYVACVQCRTRKIRCDGAKPICHNCGHRATGGDDCFYDPVPKRRGPDRTPGARQRMTQDLKIAHDKGILPVRRRRRRPEESGFSKISRPTQISNPILGGKSSASAIQPYIVSLSPRNEFSRPETGYIQSQNIVRHVDSVGQCERPDSPHYEASLQPCLNTLMPIPSMSHSGGNSFAEEIVSGSYCMAPISHGYIEDPDDGYGGQRDRANNIATQPSLDFTRKIWWDSLLSLYSFPSSRHLLPPTAQQRNLAAQDITADLRFLFRESNYWFSFFHVPSFLSNYFDPVRRERIQPSLILAALAMSTFWQSSEVGLGRTGRDRALRFRDEAQGALEASVNGGWIDETLAQAAWLLALFEVCAHPYHSTERSTSSMVMLDSIIRSLSLTSVDADDPTTSVFTPRSVPIVPERTSPKLRSRDLTTHLNRNDATAYPLQGSRESTSGCSCPSLTLGTHWPLSYDHTPLWVHTPAWSSVWSEGEIRKESCRRLCWSAMTLAAGHISYTTATKPRGLDLFISDPANYALLFSGESMTRSPSLTSSQSSKDTIWALYDRSFLLWHGCMRMRSDTNTSDTEKAHFAISAWLEADTIEDSLNKHTCGFERAFIFHGREYLFNTRMCISYEFQRYIPLVTADVNGLFHRRKAEEWLSHQAAVAKRFMSGLHAVTGNARNLLARRPFFVFWFMSQVSRSLSLWTCDHTMIVALEVCKAFLAPIDYLTALWPCPEQRYRYDSIREQLTTACYVAGVSPPSPSNYSLPIPSQEALV